MEYFEVKQPEGDGVCSDNRCPCNEDVIPRGTGYVFIDQELVNFRRDCLDREQLREKLSNIRKMGFVVIDPNVYVPIMMCKKGAELRGIDLEVASADAKYWWKTGKVPLRPTPRKK